MTLSLENIQQWALECGFEQSGIASVDVLTEERQRLDAWLASSRNGTMRYMANNVDVRTDPRQLFSEVRSVVVVLANYYPAERQPTGQPRIATYAYGQDYHYVVRSRLNRLAEIIHSHTPHQWRVFADSAPIFERAWAVRAGLGWIGRSGMLVNQHLGTYSLIGVMLTSLQLPQSRPIVPRCGKCHRCIDACPTAAIVVGEPIDARRCLSYLTIEHREPLADEFLRAAADTLYGCDRCLEVCPWNRFAHPSTIPEFAPIEGLFAVDWATIGRGAFDRLLRLSPMQRAGYKKINIRALQLFNL